MKTKQVVPAGTLITEHGDKWLITDVKPLPRQDWMTPSQQRWNVIPFMPDNNWIYFSERVLICKDPTIVYGTHNFINVIVNEYLDEKLLLADLDEGNNLFLQEVGAIPSDTALMQEDGHE